MLWKFCATCRTSPSTWFARARPTGDGACGLRDYGTGSWEGGDANHAHDTVGARGGRGGSGTLDKRSADAMPDAFAADVCSCGATRVDQQLGLEPTPDLYVANMVDVFREVRRVLRADGTLWLNIGDSYASGRPGSPSDQIQVADTFRAGPMTRGGKGQDEASGLHAHLQGTAVRPGVPDGLKPKDLVGIPWRLAFALQADGWYLRSDIIWAKPNPMPESVTDRPTKAHEYLFLLTKSAKYSYDADAIREPLAFKTLTVREGPTAYAYANDDGGNVKTANWNNSVAERKHNHAGANKRTVWEIATEAYPDAHFATFPQALVEPCIKAATSEHGCCPVCGAPWEREVERTKYEPPAAQDGQRFVDASRGDKTWKLSGADYNRTVQVIGESWRPTCDHNVAPVPSVVLDPFLGSGTTALVARRLGRRSIGIELNPAYAQLAARRLQQQSLFACVVDESAGLTEEGADRV